MNTTKLKLIVATVRDISRRKVAEASIRQSEAKYRIVLENANEAIFVAQDEKLRFFNYKVVELSGVPSDELLDVSMFHFVHPDDKPHLMKRYHARLDISDRLHHRAAERPLAGPRVAPPRSRPVGGRTRMAKRIEKQFKVMAPEARRRLRRRWARRWVPTGSTAQESQ